MAFPEEFLFPDSFFFALHPCQFMGFSCSEMVSAKQRLAFVDFGDDKFFFSNKFCLKLG